MFHVFYYTNNGEAVLVNRYHHEDDACEAVEALGRQLPNTHCDYVYKDVG